MFKLLSYVFVAAVLVFAFIFLVACGTYLGIRAHDLYLEKSEKLEEEDESE